MRKTQNFIGLPVLGLKGKEIGKLVDFVFDENTLRLTEIVVDEGLFKGRTNFLVEQIEEFKEDAVTLKIAPSLQIRGMVVYDVDNNIVGNIKEIEYDKYEGMIEDIIIETDKKKYLKASSEDVIQFGKNVILSKRIDELQKVKT
ncbi:MAG: PRC-barrel domain-containing protein [Candidatus Altiarchaeota archaeon]